MLLEVKADRRKIRPDQAVAGFETYAGALVRRGEAVAEVTATGAHTKFGRTAELVRTAHVVSSQQKAVLRVVRNLALVNGILILIMVGYACINAGSVAGDVYPCRALGARALAKTGCSSNKTLRSGQSSSRWSTKVSGTGPGHRMVRESLLGTLRPRLGSTRPAARSAAVRSPVPENYPANATASIDTNPSDACHPTGRNRRRFRKPTCW